MRSPDDPALFFRLHVFICTNRRPDDNKRGSCAGRGSEVLREHLKDATKSMGLGDIRINSAGCLDRCGHGPVMVIYPEGVWYSFHTIADIDEILDTHIVKGGRVARLMVDQD
ncbi:Ferredoxin [Candidatus Terasakiella magnetica]|nr:Ferredoxin [Candidatus Terasakiella magnetica]